MKIHGLNLHEGADVQNMTCPRGDVFPDNPTDGELFRLKGNTALPDGLYCFEDTWQLLAKVQPLIEVGTTYELDVNTNQPIPVVWNKTYLISNEVFELDGSRIGIKQDGDYEVYYTVSVQSTTRNKAKTIGLFVRVSKTGYIFNRSRTYQFAADSSTNDKTTASVKFTTPLRAGEAIELCGQRLGGDGSAYTLADNCTLGIRRIL